MTMHYCTWDVHILWDQSRKISIPTTPVVPGLSCSGIHPGTLGTVHGMWSRICSIVGPSTCTTQAIDFKGFFIHWTFHSLHDFLVRIGYDSMHVQWSLSYPNREYPVVRIIRPGLSCILFNAYHYYFRHVVWTSRSLLQFTCLVIVTAVQGERWKENALANEPFSSGVKSEHWIDKLHGNIHVFL